MIATAARRSVPSVGRRAKNLRMPDWGAAGWAGLISGAVFMAYELLLMPVVHGGNAWVPTRMVAAIVFGREILPAPLFSASAEPSSGVFFTALALHFSLSLAFVRVLSLFLYRLHFRRALAAGAAFGLGLYFLNFHGFTAFFPWFAELRGPVTALGNVLFGAGAAALYKVLESREPLIE